MKQYYKPIGAALAILILGLILMYPVRDAVAQAQVDRQIQAAVYPKLQNLGSTHKLVILPLFENAVSRDDLIAGHGVAYLIKTDHANILFDLGFDTATLQHNMQVLGITIKDFDMIVISHDHPDHVGGDKWWPDKTFSLEDTQVDLGNLQVYVPTPLTYPGLNPNVVDRPQVIAEGVATLGTIPYKEFYKPPLFLPIRYEQSLAVNVQGVGLVVIVGCGHPGVKNIMDRAGMVSDVPVIGLVGGLHYIDKSASYVGDEISRLSGEHLRLLAISPHDSSAPTIDLFRKSIPSIYQDIAVGKQIMVMGN